MPYQVYFLYSPNFSKTYVGFTSNLEGRLKSHNELAHKGWTHKYRPWDLVFTETYILKTDAMKRELFLKTGRGREELKGMLKKWIEQNG